MQRIAPKDDHSSLALKGHGFLVILIKFYLFFAFLMEASVYSGSSPPHLPQKNLLCVIAQTISNLGNLAQAQTLCPKTALTLVDRAISSLERNFCLIPFSAASMLILNLHNLGQRPDSLNYQNDIQNLVNRIEARSVKQH